jgi:hypothetical protein
MSQVRAVEILTLVPPGVIKMEKALRGLWFNNFPSGPIKLRFRTVDIGALYHVATSYAVLRVMAIEISSKLDVIQSDLLMSVMNTVKIYRRAHVYKVLCIVLYSPVWVPALTLVVGLPRNLAIRSISNSTP